MAINLILFKSKIKHIKKRSMCDVHYAALRSHSTAQLNPLHHDESLPPQVRRNTMVKSPGCKFLFCGNSILMLC